MQYAYTADCRAPDAGKAGTPADPSNRAVDTITTSTARRGKGYSWNCYPNPTPDILHVELEGEVAELFVTDVTGKIVLRAVPAHRKAAIQLGSFPTGIYFLTFFTGKKWEKARILVSK